jgi:hypothetical protein
VRPAAYGEAAAKAMRLLANADVEMARLRTVRRHDRMGPTGLALVALQPCEYARQAERSVLGCFVLAKSPGLGDAANSGVDGRSAIGHSPRAGTEVTAFM